MSYFDLKASLPSLLQVEDRTSMAVSLESRVPLLDHRLIEFVASVPSNLKFADGEMKYLFKKAVKNTVAQTVLKRTDKMGFPVPLNSWLKQKENPFIHDVLFSSQARERGLYNFKEFSSVIKGESLYGRGLWGLLCIELWHRIYIDGDYSF
jgi:asparagine synthase (glutamine-hydrolysing)